MKNIQQLFDHFDENIKQRGMDKLTCMDILDQYDKKILLYGCGNVGVVFYERLKMLGRDILAFLDNGKSIYGNQYKDKKIDTSSRMAELLADGGTEFIIIVTLFDIMDYQQIKKDLIEIFEEKAKIRPQIFYFTQFRAYDELFYGGTLSFSAYLGENVNLLYENRERIESVYHSFEDTLSQNAYLELLNFHIVSDFIPFTLLPFEELYFAYDLYRIIETEVFVDCGAYDGDTLRTFVKNQNGKYKKYYAVEADKKNTLKLRNTVKELKLGNVEVLQCFLTDRKRKVSFGEGQGTSYARKTIGGGYELEADTLDNLVGTKQPTFIKMNIEGAELKALRGASGIIRNCAPVLAVQAHHKMCDLWEIIETIRAYSTENYHFFLRNYKGIVEYTVYAIPDGRMK